MTISSQSGRSARTVLTNRSAMAFACRARTGVLTLVIALLATTSSKGSWTCRRGRGSASACPHRRGRGRGRAPAGRPGDARDRRSASTARDTRRPRPTPAATEGEASRERGDDGIAARRSTLVAGIRAAAPARRSWSAAAKGWRWRSATGLTPGPSSHPTTTAPTRSRSAATDIRHPARRRARSSPPAGAPITREAGAKPSAQMDPPAPESPPQQPRALRV